MKHKRHKVNGKTYKTPQKPERDEEVGTLLHRMVGKSHSEMGWRSGLSPSTIAAWRGYRTRYPQFMSMRMAAAAVGYEYKLVKKGR